MLRPVGDKYELTNDIVYKDVVVPAGYTTDGISYKFRLFGVFINKFDPMYIEAVIVHDYLTDLGEWDKANKYFEEMLPDTKTATLMIVGVKLYKRIYIDLIK